MEITVHIFSFEYLEPLQNKHKPLEEEDCFKGGATAKILIGLKSYPPLEKWFIAV